MARSSGTGTHGASVAATPSTDRVNTEPAILKGLTASETMIAAAVFFPIWLVLGTLLAVLIGRWYFQIITLLGVIGPMVSVWNFAGLLAGFKRGRPDYHYMHAFRWWRHRVVGLGPVPYIAHVGGWTLGRRMAALVRASTGMARQFIAQLGLS